jgi:hypothetical protein
MNFQVTILKVLVSYPDGFASLTDLKRDIAILATSGKDWSERTKRLAARVAALEADAHRADSKVRMRGASLLETIGWCHSAFGG